MRETGLLGAVLPALAAAPATVVDHAVAVLARVPAVPTLRLAALLHVLPADGGERLLLALRQPRRITDGVAALLRAHVCPVLAPASPLPRSAAEVRRWLSGVGFDRAEALLALGDAEAAALPPARVGPARDEVARLAADVDALRRTRPPLFPQDLALDGRAVMAILGAGPGPHVGEALRHLLDRVLEEPGRNDAAALEAELRAWWAARRP
jgi:tRNA nucleotidyltransferase (CCA-adding enzyme)